MPVEAAKFHPRSNQIKSNPMEEMSFRSLGKLWS